MQAPPPGTYTPLLVYPTIIYAAKDGGGGGGRVREKSAFSRLNPLGTSTVKFPPSLYNTRLVQVLRFGFRENRRAQIRRGWFK